MGICYQGKTLKEAVDERDRLFKETGHYYGLEKLELTEEDPAKFMRFQMRLVAACVNAREQAKLITANPVALIMGELMFMIANPEGDCVAASFGLQGHIQSFPSIVRFIADLGFEDDPGIREGDIFATNDAQSGSPHNADCYNWVPVLYKGDLIAWTVGLNHILDVGGIQPGNLGMLSPDAFTDGYIYPPLKTGENFKQHKWWELTWRRRTRTVDFNVMDDKMRVTGAVALHDKILEVVEEFGIDYFRKGLREIVEREMRVLLQRIKTQAVPGIYQFLVFGIVKYKGVVGRLFADANKDWLLHQPAEFHILPDGRMFIDLEGVSSEGDFHCNCYEPGLRAMTSLGCVSMFTYTQTVNTCLKYVTDWNLPPGTMYNPTNSAAGTIMAPMFSGQYAFLFYNCLSYSYFARGFLDECFPQEPGGVSYGLAGVFDDGFAWAGGDMSLITCSSSGARPYKDGDVAAYCLPNSQVDLGETEINEFTQPTNLNLGIRIIPDYCGHGKFRGGLGLGLSQLIVDPGQRLTVAPMVTSAGIPHLATGMCGGYPAPNDIVYLAHDTNMREILDKGLPYPTSFVEVRDWLKEGKLTAGSVEVYTAPAPNIACKDGDLFAYASVCKGGWGDPLERESGLVENDLHYGWITLDVAKQVYGVIANEEGKAKVKESEELRQQMRNRRKERSVDAREWWKNERGKVLRKEFSEDVYNMYADCLKYEKFHRQFMGMWQLPEDHQL